MKATDESSSARRVREIEAASPPYTAAPALIERLQLEREFERRRSRFLFWSRDPARAPLDAVVLRYLLRGLGLYRRGLANAQDYRIEQVLLPCRRLPAQFDGYRILLLGDMHFDGDPRAPEAIRDLVAPLSADVCLLAGDYLFNAATAHAAAIEGLRCVLEGVQVADCVYSVLGNNDLAALLEPIRAMGVTVLYNTAAPLMRDGERIWLAGVDDPHLFQTDDLDRALQSVPPDAFTILLAHSPECSQRAARMGVAVYLCGHTHGGQICLPRLGALYRNGTYRRDQSAGIWRERGMIGYTTRGLGTTGLKVRYNCPPEAALITLRRSIDEGV